MQRKGSGLCDSFSVLLCWLYKILTFSGLYKNPVLGLGRIFCASQYWSTNVFQYEVQIPITDQKRRYTIESTKQVPMNGLWFLQSNWCALVCLLCLAPTLQTFAFVIMTGDTRWCHCAITEAHGKHTPGFGNTLVAEQFGLSILTFYSPQSKKQTFHAALTENAWRLDLLATIIGHYWPCSDGRIYP